MAKPSKSALSLIVNVGKKGSKKTAEPMPAAMAAPAPTPYKEPTPAESMARDVDYERRAATRDWAGGRISTTKHNQVHARAKKVLKGLKVGR